MSFKRIGILAWKDIVDSIKTPRLLLIIITPLIAALCMQVFFGNKLAIRVGVYSKNTTQLITTLEQVDLVAIEAFDSVETLRVAVDNGRVTIGVVLSPAFDALLANNQMPKVDFLLADNSQDGEVAMSLVQQAILAFSPAPAPVIISVEVLKPEARQGISLRGDLPVDQYLIVLWLIMGLVGNGVMLVPTLIVEERDRKTLDALLLSPASYYDVAVGKALVGVLYAVISGVLILLAQGGLSGNIFVMLALIVMSGFALSLLGLLLGVLSKNLHVLNSYASLWIFLLILPTLIGMIGPNPVIQYLQFLPTYSLTQGIVYNISGHTEKALQSLIVIFLESLLILGVVAWSLRRREKNK